MTQRVPLYLLALVLGLQEVLEALSGSLLPQLLPFLIRYYLVIVCNSHISPVTRVILPLGVLHLQLTFIFNKPTFPAWIPNLIHIFLNYISWRAERLLGQKLKPSVLSLLGRPLQVEAGSTRSWWMGRTLQLRSCGLGSGLGRTGRLHRIPYSSTHERAQPGTVLCHAGGEQVGPRG